MANDSQTPAPVGFLGAKEWNKGERLEELKVAGTLPKRRAVYLGHLG